MLLNRLVQLRISSVVAHLIGDHKTAEVVDDSDKELIRVARGDVDEDDEPQEKSHKETERSTEGNI